ncbi:MAG: hypothetical protein FWE71_01890 [Nocardioidaceae bacterium]|nr:hypothetical protein [Nocardioidaceae bacterium]MCL2613851.1 hypothetical protein [Nocardioidaceae bacterium]
MLDETADRRWEKVVIAASLGTVDGDAGDAALRRALEASGPGTSDLRCASVYALARRCGADAHEDFVKALSSNDAGTRHYALSALAACGRDGVWDEVAARLLGTMKRRQRRDSIPPHAMVMLSYLLRHAGSEPGRLPALVSLLRKHWDGLDPQGSIGSPTASWMAANWSAAAPGGPPADEVGAPEPAAVEAWLRSSPFLSELVR